MDLPELNDTLKMLGPLLGVVVGFVLKEVSDVFRAGREAKKVLLRTVTELLEFRSDVRKLATLSKRCLDECQETKTQADHSELLDESRRLASVRARMMSLFDSLAGIDPFLAMDVRRLCDSVEERELLLTIPEELEPQEYTLRLLALEAGYEGADRRARMLIATIARKHGWLTALKIWWDYSVLYFGDGFDGDHRRRRRWI